MNKVTTRLAVTLACSVAALGSTNSVTATDNLEYDAYLESTSPESEKANSLFASRVAQKTAMVAQHPLVAKDRKSSLTSTGLPVILWANPAEVAKFDRTGTPEQVAQKYLRELAPLYQLSGEQLSGAYPSHIHDTGKGALIVRFGQRHQGVEVFRNQLNLTMDQRRNLISASGFLSPHIQDNSVNLKQRKGSADPWQSGPSRAIRAAAEHLGLSALAGDVSSLRAGKRSGPYQYYTGLEQQLTRPLRVKPIYYHMPDHLEAAYYLEVFPVTKDPEALSLAFGMVVSVDGQVLMRNSLVDELSFDYRVYGNPATNEPLDSPFGEQGVPHPTGNPDNFVPTDFVPQNLLSIESGPISTGDPWLPDDAQETVGNNVDAFFGDFVDFQFRLRPYDATAGDFRAQLSSAQTFDYEYVPVLENVVSNDEALAGTVNAFYIFNYLHDWFYDAGFNESAGNAQSDNFGRGGIGGDPYLAVANAGRTFAVTPADGEASGSLFGLRGTNLVVFGGWDFTVAAHEWGHFITNRLIGDSSGLLNPQGLALGEGWSDFMGILLTVKPEDLQVTSNADFNGVYAEGAYFSRVDINSRGNPNAYYTGYRRFGYTADIDKNPLTFRHIGRNNALPQPPFFTVPGRGFNNEIHNAGEIYCNALWESYRLMLLDTGRLSFEEARDRMIRYLVAGWIGTPVNPTFLEARDALFAAVQAEDAADLALFQQAFAKRGMGGPAVAPPRTSTNFDEVVESFSVTGNPAPPPTPLPTPPPAGGGGGGGSLPLSMLGLLIFGAMKRNLKTKPTRVC